jgi:hypothetical protein
LPPQATEALGSPLVFSALRFEVAATHPSEDPIGGPKREITIEVLREDPQCLYLEVMSQWPQIPAPLKPGVPIDIGSIRRIDLSPSEYIQETYTYLNTFVGAIETSEVK